MTFYNKSIYYELYNNNTFINVKIIDNKIECTNKIILDDIYKKIKNLSEKIKTISFFISLYDYDIIKETYYWSTIKDLDRKELPIYRKNDDLSEYLQWLNKNFNNNEIETYETLKFVKRDYVFESDDLCKKSVDWNIISNPKFKNFNQLFFNAGDDRDIERYGYIYIRTIFDNIKNVNKKEIKDNTYSNFKNDIKIWNKFNTTFESIQNTMYYLFNKMKKGILVCIKNNKLVVFLPFSKYNYVNDFYTELYFDDNDKKLLLEYKKSGDKRLLEKLEKTTRYYFSKNHINTNDIILDRTKWMANDCFFKYEKWEGDKAHAIIEDMFVSLCKNRILPDSIFFLNLRDHPVLHKDLKESYTSLFDKKLDDKYVFKEYAPILSVGPSKEHVDIGLVTQDDWLRVSKKYYPDDCKNGYINEINILDWDKKIGKAVFRGSATGCKIENNIRILASNLSKKNPEYLDAGIISLNRKFKKSLNKPLSIIDSKVNKSKFMTLEEKAGYKYILNLDGHVAAFRLGHEFSLKSVILIPESKYYVWFTPLLKPYEHFVPVNEDLSNLIDQIKWCINNDDKCKKIASNSYNFYKKYLEKDGILDYLQDILYKIQFKSLEFKRYKERIGIITIYRNSPGFRSTCADDKPAVSGGTERRMIPADNSRLKQKRLFLYWMNKMLSQICDYNIVVVEQKKDNYFNIGKLKNIGFDYLNNYANKNNKYDNYIFVDIDMIPDSKLINYFFKKTDSLNLLAINGTRYEDTSDKTRKRPFAGGMISCTGNIFKELNGYANNYIGWGGEDQDLLLRLSELNKPVYLPKEGAVIDIEEKNNITKIFSDKKEELTKNDEREKLLYEKNVNYKNFRNNGLSNLNYKILDKFEYEKNYHIIVDLMLEEDKKQNPELYNFKSNISKDEYKKIVNDQIYNIKQNYF
jgi:hypothetical protein